MNINILIADDEPNQLELMSFNLSNAGYSIIKATNGKEAIEFVEKYKEVSGNEEFYDDLN